MLTDRPTVWLAAPGQTRGRPKVVVCQAKFHSYAQIRLCHHLRVKAGRDQLHGKVSEDHSYDILLSFELHSKRNKAYYDLFQTPSKFFPFPFIDPLSPRDERHSKTPLAPSCRKKEHFLQVPIRPLRERRKRVVRRSRKLHCAPPILWRDSSPPKQKLRGENCWFS